MRLEVEVQRKRLAAVLERAHEILLACVREFVPAHGKEKVQAQKEREKKKIGAMKGRKALSVRRVLLRD